MTSQEISLTLTDKEGNTLGVLKLSEIKDREHLYNNCTEIIDNCEVNFNNIPKLLNLDDNIPIIIRIPNNIFLLEETNYQLVFISEFKDIKKISFLHLEKLGKIPVFTPLNLGNKLYGGLLNFRSFVGKTYLDVKINGIISNKIPIEVRSKKMNYQEHYPSMIADLAKAASGLIFYVKSPTFQYVDFKQRVKKSFYEDFMLLEYIFRPENLLSAYGYIKRDPYKVLKKYVEDVPTSYAFSIGPSELVNIVTNPEHLIQTDNVPYKWPNNMDKYVPDKISQNFYLEIVDNPENRFLKYFLELLNNLIIEMNSYVNSNGVEGYPAEKIKYYNEIIKRIISDKWLKDVGNLYQMPSNSQVLQKREGYREILDLFLVFEFTFKFQWDEIIEDIKGYQQKLSELYEIWCYLKLFEILNKLQHSKVNFEAIFNLNEKNWNIKIKRGMNSIQQFSIPVEDEEVKIKLIYNKNFKRDNLDYYAYSLEMKPDYTLMIEIDNKEYLFHFDAKYKCDLEKSFKNEDIYKMHTYKDAIDNTKGAYVLYPGLEPEIYYERENDIESVGAFPLNPGRALKDEIHLENFIRNLLTKLEN